MLPYLLRRFFGCLTVAGIWAASATAGENHNTSDTAFARRNPETPFHLVSCTTCDALPCSDDSNVVWNDTCQCASGTEGAGLYAGFAFVFAKPHLKESFKAFAVDLPTGTQQLIGFDHTYDLSPRVFLGYEAPGGFGLRARYWQYDQEADPLSLVSSNTSVVAAQTVTVVFPGIIQSTAAGQVLSVGNGLKVQTVDLEGTQHVSFAAVDAVIGMGLRYATLRQTFQATILDGRTPTQWLASERQFEGFGPLLSAVFRRPFGASGVSGFGAMGGGILFGSKSMQRQLFDTSNSFPPFISMDNVEEVTGMGELQVGLEWAHCGRLGEWFVRGAYEAQLWTDGGAPTLTFLGFEGLSFSLGVGY